MALAIVISVLIISVAYLIGKSMDTGVRLKELEAWRNGGSDRRGGHV